MMDIVNLMKLDVIKNMMTALSGIYNEVHRVQQKEKWQQLTFMDMPKIINKNNNMVLFADDTSIIVTGTNKLDFERNCNQTFKDINS
jgi:hypothetical protein